MATTGKAAHRKILTGSPTPEQQAIVAARAGNHLVLAGPGAGSRRR